MCFFSRHGFNRIDAELSTPDLVHQSEALGLGRAGSGAEDVRWDPTVEVEGDWAPIPLGPRYLDVSHRFVDGIARATLMMWGKSPTGEAIAVVGGVVGAMALRADSGRAEVEPERVPHQWHRAVIAFNPASYGEDELVELDHRLADNGIHRLPVRPDPTADGLFRLEISRIQAHSRVTQEMRSLEATALAGSSRPEPTIVDGSVGIHLGTHDRWTWPVVGVIKQHSQFPLSPTHEFMVVRLPEGHRSPMFRISPDATGTRPAMLSWYLRLSGRQASGMSGVVRIELPEPGVNHMDWVERARHANELSARLIRLRAARASYSRVSCSLDPVLRIEDRLHAMAGGIKAVKARIENALFPNRTARSMT